MLIKLVKKHSQIQFSPKIQPNKFQTHRKLSDDELDSKYLVSVANWRTVTTRDGLHILS